MSLELSLVKLNPSVVSSWVVTHNFTKLARAVGIYYDLWSPDKMGIKTASQLIIPLQEAVLKIKENPERFRQYEEPLGNWTCEDFVRWLEHVWEACLENPQASVHVDQ